MESSSAPAPAISEKAYVGTASRGLIQRIVDFCSSTEVQARRSFVRLVRWIQESSRRGQPGRELVLFIEFLEANKEIQEQFRARFANLLEGLHYVSLLSQTGIPSDSTLPTEIAQRFVGKFLPSARPARDASRLLTNIYNSGDEIRRFRRIPPDVFDRLYSALLGPEPVPVKRPLEDLKEALRLLATRVAWLGLRPEMRERGIGTGIADSPFYELLARTEDLLGQELCPSQVAVDSWHSAVSRCREEMDAVRSHLETAGVSVELVFDLQKIEACLARMESLIAALCARTRPQSILAIQHLMQVLMEGRQSDSSLSALVRENLDLVARKTVERTGRSGEHYIAHDRSEYWHMWLAAMGGGLLTVLTAAIKMRIVEAHAAPFIIGFTSGTNYAISFIFLQIFGLVLATKQPAATAATFAGIVRENRGEQRSSKIADFVSHITSTQLAAAIGNVFAVSVGAVIFERLWRMVFSESYLPEEWAAHVYTALHPFQSFTAWYAIITGVILWLAALAGGWCENFAAYYRVSQAVAEHPAGHRFGSWWMQKFARIMERNLGGWSTSIVLGYLLGFTPELGHFFGLPLDIRHVTLSTGTLALAAARYGLASLGRAWLYQAIEGIAVVFVLNLTVSFTIAGVVALRAYNVPFSEQLAILRYLVRQGLTAPLKFVLPPKNAK
jgi:site-specific recombinase